MLDLPNSIDPDGMNHANMEELKKFLREEHESRLRYNRRMAETDADPDYRGRMFKYDLSLGLTSVREEVEPGCGTAGCIAGAVHVICKTDVAMRISGGPGQAAGWGNLVDEGLDWLGIRADALRYLAYNEAELNRLAIPDCGGRRRHDLGHPLFDPIHVRTGDEMTDSLAAIAAIERVQSREFPWPDTQYPEAMQLVAA